ncbi:hypothetical protein [Flavobacterium soli]|uniref:hypothetical protein n=1 Tax=Flavobacterium soli TaxID=344881 RepID=UPI00041D9EFC|nr:hypothetical protein [Flavobacterium soli]
MITKEQIEELGFVYKQKLITNHIDFINTEIKTLLTLSLDGTVDITCENYKRSWSNINSIDELIKIIGDINKLVSE